MKTWLAMVVCVACALRISAGSPVEIRPGTLWKDDAGNPIAAHGGNLIQVGNSWYWYGENNRARGGSFGFFTGVRCYTSTDFIRWHNVGIVLAPTGSGPLSRDRRQVAYRPKVLYNAGTATYVMVLTECSNVGDGHLVYATSPTPDGPFTYRRWSHGAGGSKTMDLGAYQEGAAAYIVYSDNNNGISIDLLSDDYLSVKKRIAHISNGCEEGPAVVKAGDRYFLVTSWCTGWRPNPCHYRVASDLAGPWNTKPDGNLGDATSFHSQTGYILTIPGTAGTTYVNVSDRWTDDTEIGATYPWLPLRIQGSTMSMKWYDVWYLDLDAGTWALTKEP